MKRSRAAIGTAVLTSAVTSIAMLAPAPASAAPTISEPLASGLVTPLQFEVQGDRLVVAQTFAGLLTRIKDDGTPKVLHAEEGSEVTGLAITGRHIAFTTTSMNHEEPGALLKLWKGHDDVRTVADLRKFEEDVNPDADFAYGFRNLDKECADQVPSEMGGGYPYSGIVDAHPYALANAPGGGWYVADAAANAILKVSPKGGISIVKVLRPQRFEVTAAAAESMGMPDCVVGSTYAFEAVPTDVEVGRKGRLVVSLLPGGPEDPSLGARGSVVRVDPRTGRTKTLASGLAAATNVALAPKGGIFVAELFGGTISKIKDDGTTKVYVEAPLPAALEWAHGQLYASVDALNEEQGGSVVTIDR